MLSTKTFYNDENVLYLCYPAWQPQATCGSHTPEMRPLDNPGSVSGRRGFKDMEELNREFYLTLIN